MFVVFGACLLCARVFVCCELHLFVFVIVGRVLFVSLLFLFVPFLFVF